MVPFKMHSFLLKSLNQVVTTKTLDSNGFQLLFLFKTYPSIIVRSCNKRLRVSLSGSNLYTNIKNGTVQNAFFSIKIAKSSCYNKNSGFKWLSDVVLIQKVSIYNSEIA